ncbi:Uncharacterised protein [Mycobacterium tuberculosis]|uniref:Uncharacterized protein n=1 Tax=Mycobacterium tuberculosis TaxID=1773 RepID=A0A654TUN6_MYCTX|nr:Uncharacterised protein [Mycobacterium tuberculosis]COW66407.1 Uncharacterised protein [Mycobacterium tuberculosis]COZ38962.1 Uncharacterised protein [Mycobacterium tuberculosis]
MKPVFADCSSTISIVGGWPPGKISVAMNLRKRASHNVSGKPWSTICCLVRPVIVCSSNTPSGGRILWARAKKSA